MRKIIPCSTGECTDSYYAGQNTTTISFQIPMEVLPTGGKRELRHHWADEFTKAKINWDTEMIELEYSIVREDRKSVV